MLLVGLTGNIGSGKTTVCRLFSRLGIPVYHADDRGKSFLDSSEVKDQLVEIFGTEVIDASGNIDRQRLAGIVFHDKDKLQQLNGIIHPLVRNDFKKWVAEQTEAPYVIEEAAILIETGHHEDFDKIILVTAPEKLRIKRVCERDGVAENHVRQRARHQLEEKAKLSHAHFIIKNDEKHDLISQVKEIHNQLLEKT